MIKEILYIVYINRNIYLFMILLFAYKIISKMKLLNCEISES